MTPTLTRPRQTVAEILHSVPTARIMTELTGACEYGVRLTWRDEDGDLEIRTYYGTTEPWTREHAETQLAVGRRYQARHGITGDAHLVTRYQGTPWRHAIA
ncbi:hypothetical protein GCM10017673_14630 [Streptosporangium violaceochromogenes]|nr:hypothetical protein GCM10017673_14630 [Streptosporangium violaceochromogenes]